MTSPVAKPKKQLTEAQRLAFLKGREKRMANIEKARLTKEEAQQAEINEPVVKTEPPPSPPAPPPVAVAPSNPSIHIDSDEIANKVVKIFMEKTAKPKRERKPKPKPRPDTPPREDGTISQLQNAKMAFNWL